MRTSHFSLCTGPHEQRSQICPGVAVSEIFQRGVHTVIRAWDLDADRLVKESWFHHFGQTI